MKTKKKRSLKNIIIWDFAIVTLMTAFITSPLNNCFEEYIYKVIGDNDVLQIWQPLGFAYFMFEVLICFISGIIFYCITKKAFENDKRRKLEEQNMLYAAIAHDLKTPITSIQGFAKALADGKISIDEQQEICDLIYRKTQSMNELVNTLFQYARLGTEEFKLDLSEIDLCVLVRDVIADNYSDLEEHNIDLEIDIPDSAINITGDRQELKRVFTNLIINTYRHNPDNIRVLVKIKAKDGNCIVTIADTGKEIPDDTDIFEPFVTENTARTIGRGSGMGLAIAKLITEKHCGNLSVRNDIQGYTKEFVAILPQKKN